MNLNAPRWTPDEDRLLKANWNVCSKFELMDLLPERSWQAIQKKAARNNYFVEDIRGRTAADSSQDSFFIAEDLENVLPYNRDIEAAFRQPLDLSDR